MAGAALVVGLARLDCIAGDGSTVNRLARRISHSRPRLCLRRRRQARQPASHRPPLRLRHHVCPGASHLDGRSPRSDMIVASSSTRP